MLAQRGILVDQIASNSEGHIKSVSLSNRKCQTRPSLIDTDCNETIFYPFLISANNCGGSCNNVDDTYDQTK